MLKYNKVNSVCTYCGVGCEISAFLDHGKIVKIEPMEGGISNGGKICIKGKTGYEFLYHERRLKENLIKKSFIEKNKELFKNIDLSSLQDKNNNFFSAPLELALQLAYTKLNDIKTKHGPNNIGFIGGARTNCESGWLFQKFARSVVDTPNIDNCARVCHAPSLAGLKKALGEGAATNPFDDILQTEFILVIGSNTTEAHPIVANRVLEAVKHGTTLAVADIREIQLSKKANFQLMLPPEANILFLNAIARVIIEEKLYDKHFINHRVKEFEQYKKAILSDEFSKPEVFLKLKGYDKLAAQAKEIARIYAKSKSMILWGLGITEHTDGSKTVQSIANLALLTGNIGKIGAGLMPLRGQNNVQGACDVGCLPYFAPSYQKAKIDGLKTPEMIDAMLDNKMQALWVMGEDITHIHANINKAIKAVEKLDLLVVQEIMECDISKRADIVFAVKSQYEKQGVCVNAERRLHLTNPIIKSDLPDDWEILNAMSHKFGFEFNYLKSEDVWNDARAETTIHSGATYEMLEKHPQQWPVTKDGGTIRLYEKEFRTQDGLANIIYHPYKPKPFVAALLEGKKPMLTLSTGRTIAHYNNASQTSVTQKLLDLYNEDVVLINHDSAKHLDLKKKYALASKYGKSAKLTFKDDKRVPSGVLFTTFHFCESKINALFGDESDDTTMTPRFKAIEVEIELD